jgi:hypothetical protein
MAIANQDPQNVVHYVVNFTTTNLDNGDTFVEPHNVSGPTPVGTFNIPLNAVTISGGKVVVPLQSTTGSGSYWLKFWLPQAGANASKMYVTFCVKNASYSDGYYDYQTGIPSAYRTALRNWIKDNAILNINATTTKTKKLLFTVYGLDTNQVSSAIQYHVSFVAVFTGQSIPSGTGTVTRTA